MVSMPNYAIKPTPELALRSNRALLPARLIAALDLMRNVLRILGVSFVALVVIGVVALRIYDRSNFSPHLAVVYDVVERSDPNADTLSPEFERLLLASLGQGLSCWSANLLYREVHLGHEGPRPSEWKRTYPLWCTLTWLHLWHQERLMLVVQLTPVGNGKKGLISAAQEMFGKSLSEVSHIEAATLVALAYAPYARNDPAKLAELAQMMMQRVRREI